ncbi:helix-turn-helix domain-containing protein [Megamonas hypermegale]|uniref:helix-turn-helix domain-containing protein n=1 Tax=Megamonas hypermegale TaxID=158847 RepID=UPI0026EFE336|nr:helix-turn-helix domain-containing protein [Megamonas hypermegale]
MKSLLQQIQPIVQNTANAIAKVIQMEVEVADNNFIRIAGTGKYAENIGELMNAGFVYHHVLQTGDIIMIEHPGFHVLCKPCPFYQNCPEDTELAAPIKFGEKTIGVIGLVSFNKTQTEHFIANKEWMIQFIQKMAELIAFNLSDITQDEPYGTSLQLAQLERNAIKKALELVSGKTSKADRAAKLLGISRATLYRKIKEYDL